MDWRFTKGNNDIVPDLAAEFLRLRPDCVIAVGVSAVRAFKQLTDMIPIIMPTINADPVEIGLIASLARPGGNITGFTGIDYDLAGKSLELIKEAVPKARRPRYYRFRHQSPNRLQVHSTQVIDLKKLSYWSRAC